MANEQNLIPYGDERRSKTEQRAAQSRGGKKSGETRRRKRDMKNAAKYLLGLQITSKELKKKLKELGISEEDATYQMGIMVGMLQSAMKGNTKAAAFLRDTAGESPALKIREEELKLKKAEMKQDQEESTLADAIESAYKERQKEGEDNAER